MEGLFGVDKLERPSKVGMARRGLRKLLSDPRGFSRRAQRYLMPGTREHRRRYRMNLREWTEYHQRIAAEGTCSWMGVRAFKLPLDAWVYQELIHELRPDVIVEIGSAEGGSTLYFAHLLDLLGTGSVVSVDIDHNQFRAEHPRITTITGDSSSPTVVEQVASLCAGKHALVVHDGDHAKDAVLKDLRAYARFVPVGGYLVVEDGIIDTMRPGGGIGSFREGPLAAVHEFVRENRAFAIDPDRERYLLTSNPHGWLRRTAPG